jgi:ABC-2 type transport system ATP-binding protein
MLVEVKGADKRYGKQVALAGVDLTVGKGEVVGLAGCNGAGKTTLINLLMGFLEADGGELKVAGESPLGRRHLDRVGWMPERPVFPSHLRVGQVMALQAAVFPTWDPAHAGELAGHLGLGAGDRVRTLSRGQLARLALLCALGHRPQVLLLDDPTLGLDPGARRLLLGELLAAAAEAGTGVLLATHLLGEADQALDRLAILDHHRIVCQEPVAGIKHRCRRLVLPQQAPAPPATLQLIESREGVMTSAWDETVWQEYQQRVPGARCEQIDLETIFIVLTGGEQ